MPKGKGFQSKLSKRRGCTCWDCLREAGLTPPLSLRNNFPGMHPHSVYAKDEGGDPVLTHGARKAEPKEAGDTPEEKRHLREAVRNREAI